MRTALLIRRVADSTRILVEGHIDASSASAFSLAVQQDVAVLAAGLNPIVLDLHDLELSDGSAVAEAVNAMRALLARAPLVIRHAPQMLAHTLYKTGLLRNGRLTLESPREEEGRSS